MQIKSVAVIGGGAAGFFAAFSCLEHHPGIEVTLFEKTSKLLQKVKVSGGGRCNVTHNALNISHLSKGYPRGSNQLKKCFGQFNVNHTIQWFEKRSVELKVEEDGRMFPITDSSQTIIDCFLRETQVKGIEILTSHEIKALNPQEQGGFELRSDKGTKHFDKVVIATGGSPKLTGFYWLHELGHKIEIPVPSLFTFNMPGNPITKLMGLSVENASAKIIGTKLQHTGPLLITHWGMSGPAILKLSAWGARHLHDLKYEFVVQINWTGDATEEKLRDQLADIRTSKKKLANFNPTELPARLWEYLLHKIGVDQAVRWVDLDKKSFNKMINVLVNDQYPVKGKTTFKEEFVTCGGVSLQDVDFKTMQSRKVDGMYFAGEVLDVDGITGGFNFQAAWSTGYVAGKLL